MLEFIAGVTEEALRDEAVEVAFEVSGNQLVTTVRSNGKDAQNTQLLNRATNREAGRAVGGNLIEALIRGR